MKKVKLFFVAATLVLATVGVFAGSKKFDNPTNLKYWDGSAYVTVSTAGVNSAAFEYDPSSTTVANPAQIKNTTGTAYTLYYNPSGSIYYQVYLQ